MSGEGMVGMDVALWMITFGAACVNLHFLPGRFRISVGVGMIRLLRLVGWVILSARFGFVLLTEGDILITVPSAIAIAFLASGEIVTIFSHGKVITL